MSASCPHCGQPMPADTQPSKRKSTLRPSGMQREVLRFMLRNHPSEAIPALKIPSRVAWYASDVLKRMVKRGWVIEISGAHAMAHPTYKLTDEGKALAETL